MSGLACTALLLAMGGCAAEQAPPPPALLRAVSTPTSSAPSPQGRALWPLDPRPLVVRGFEAPPQPWAAGHRGVDLLGTTGQPVRAVLGGRVAFSGVVAGRGVVSVEHGDGRRTTYEPLTDRVAVGVQVRAGDFIGRLTATDSHCVPRACLHWGLRIGPADYRDPLTLVGGRRPVVLLPLLP